MTLEDLLQILAAHPGPVAGALVLPALLSWLVSQLHATGEGGVSPWKYAYAVLLYAACVPGMFAAVLSGYALFFRNENLLQVNLLVYFLPILTMIATLLLIRRAVRSFDLVPGFGRLSGLMVILGVSFAVAFALHRFRFGIFFFGPLAQLGVIALAIFALLPWAAGRVAGRREPCPLRTIMDDLPPKEG